MRRSLKDNAVETLSKKYPVRSDLVINSLGEVFVGGRIGGGQDLICSDINITEFQNRLGRPPRKKDLDAEFLRQVRKGLSGETPTAAIVARTSIDFVQRVWALQKLNDGRFRVWARDRSIRLVTEFRYFTDAGTDGAWRRIYGVAGELGADVSVLNEGRELEISYLDSNPETKPIKIVGKNHDRPYRQVEVSLYVTDLSTAQTKKLRDKVARVTQPIWNKYGVNVC